MNSKIQLLKECGFIHHCLISYGDYLKRRFGIFRKFFLAKELFLFKGYSFMEKVKFFIRRRDFNRRFKFIQHINQKRYELMKEHWIFIGGQINFKIVSGKAFSEREEVRSFYAIAREVFYDDSYKTELVIKPEDIVVDLGANVGLFSTYVKELYPSTKIYAFEPEERNFKLLKKNMEEYKEVYLYKKAVGDKEKKEDLVLSQNYLSHSLRSSFYKNATTSLVERIDVIPLDKVIKGGVNVIKIDIEGYEKKAILGAKNIIKTYNPLLLVAIEHSKGEKKEIIDTLDKIDSHYKSILLNEDIVCFYLPGKHYDRVNCLKSNN